MGIGIWYDNHCCIQIVPSLTIYSSLHRILTGGKGNLLLTHSDIKEVVTLLHNYLLAIHDYDLCRINKCQDMDNNAVFIFWMTHTVTTISWTKKKKKRNLKIKQHYKIADSLYREQYSRGVDVPDSEFFFFFAVKHLYKFTFRNINILFKAPNIGHCISLEKLLY